MKKSGIIITIGDSEIIKYHLRRKEKEITNKEEIIKILKSGKYAIISMARQNEPYIVTLSYGYDTKKKALYFHCAQEGLKMDFIKENPHVCGTIIEDNGYKDGCGQVFRSVVFRGKMTIIEGLEEKKHAFEVLVNHLENDPNYIKNKHLNKENVFVKPGILRLDIQEITGKEEKEES